MSPPHPVRRRSPRGLSEADRTVWTSFTREIVPLKGAAPPREALPEAPREVAAVAQGEAGVATPGRGTGRQQRMPGPSSSDVEIGVRNPGLDDTGWKALTARRVSAARRLDLHGRTAQAAFVALHDFLLRAHADRLRQVEIITGRGSGETGGILRRELPHWLNRPELRRLILAAAHPHPGNLGSVRVLLRRR